jgi:CBS domain-containing protein/protein required for attachment to host cells
MTQVFEVMTRGVRSLAPQDSIVRAAQAMDELDVGVVPVCDGDRLVGMVTDRDIVVRAVAKGRAADDTPLADVMSPDPRWCFEDQSVDEVLEQMRDARIRRVAVLDHAEHLVGMLSLGDVAVKADGDGAGIVLEEISEPAQPDGRNDPSRASASDGAAADGGAPDDGAAGRATGGGISAESDRHDGRGDDGVRADDPRSNDGGGREGRPANARWADRGVAPDPAAKTVWVLVADEALARILRRPEEGGDLEDVEALTDPAAHAKEGDFQRDATGRRAGVAPQGSRQGSPQHRLRGTASVTASAGEEEQHLEAQDFARRVAQHLADAWRQKRFDELRIVAAPRFLGKLRKELDAHVSAVVSDELNKDLIHEGNGEITRRLFGGAAGA